MPLQYYNLQYYNTLLHEARTIVPYQQVERDGNRRACVHEEMKSVADNGMKRKERRLSKTEERAFFKVIFGSSNHCNV